MNLTAKQEAFCQAIADGMTQADAYRTAFNVKASTKASTIQDSASKLMKNPLVTHRVTELKGKLSEKALWTREMSVKALVTAYKAAKDRDNSAGMTGAIKELNAMHGFNAPARVEMTGKDGKDLTPKTQTLVIGKDTTPEQMKALALALGSIGDEPYDVVG